MHSKKTSVVLEFYISDTLEDDVISGDINTICNDTFIHLVPGAKIEVQIYLPKGFTHEIRAIKPRVKNVIEARIKEMTQAQLEGELGFEVKYLFGEY